MRDPINGSNIGSNNSMGGGGGTFGKSEGINKKSPISIYESYDDPLLKDFFMKKFGLMSKDQHHGKPISDGPGVSYKIAILTEDKRGAGSQANVFLSLVGGKGRSIKKRLRPDTQSGGFPRGSTQVVEMSFPDVGRLEAVILEHNGLEEKHSWLVKELKITDIDRAKNYTVPCGRWLSLFRDDCKTTRKLPVNNSKTLKSTIYRAFFLKFRILG